MWASRLDDCAAGAVDEMEITVMNDWLSTIAGALFVAGGLMLFRFREPAANANGRAQRAMGGPVREEVARRGATPFWMGFAGIAMMFTGAVSVIFGLLGVFSLLK